ncbi:MAG: flippase-like domain-containing protein [Ekhidna sp.]|nr:flippase-like domain-containing protein [Ekhidna sp.]
MGSKLKKSYRTLLKFALSGLALWFVFSKVNLGEVAGLVLASNPLFLISAAFFFIASKVISAFRLNLFFSAIGLNLSQRFNLKLYWIGMFYNLFLPGGIGGDGYKIYLLNKQSGLKVKHLIQACLIDRISGLVSLLFLAGIGFLFLGLSSFLSWIRMPAIICLILFFPVLFMLTKCFFRQFLPALGKSVMLSLGVQLLQVMSALLILSAIGVEKSLVAYSVLFLASSFISILPFTIGGLGSREFIFLMGYPYFGINANLSITLSLLFTLITALVSFGGVFMKVEKDQKS